MQRGPSIGKNHCTECALGNPERRWQRWRTWKRAGKRAMRMRAGLSRAYAMLRKTALRKSQLPKRICGKE